MKIEDYLHLYLGCDTSHGKLVGINGSTCFMLSQSGEINLADLNDQSQSIKPILRKFSAMNNNESTESLRTVAKIRYRIALNYLVYFY